MARISRNYCRNSEKEITRKNIIWSFLKNNDKLLCTISSDFPERVYCCQWGVCYGLSVFFRWVNRSIWLRVGGKPQNKIFKKFRTLWKSMKYCYKPLIGPIKFHNKKRKFILSENFLVGKNILRYISIRKGNNASTPNISSWE